MVGRDCARAREVDSLGAFEKLVSIDEVLHDLALDHAEIHLRVLFLLQVFLVYELGRHDEYGVRVEQITPRLALVHAIRTRVLVSARLATVLVARLHFAHDFRLKIVVAEIGPSDGDETIRGTSRQVYVHSGRFAHVAHARLAVRADFTVTAAWFLLAAQLIALAELACHLLHALEDRL